MCNLLKYIIFIATALMIWGCVSLPDAQTSRELGEKMVATSYPGMPE